MLSVLFDLDDTLIINNAEQFTRVYLNLLGKHLQDRVEPQKMVQALWDGTREMVTKSTIAGTLESAFDRVFYPAIGYSKEDLSATLTDFYKRIFPLLKNETAPQPEAVGLIERCLANGWNVAIATNPLFPEMAVHHRLSWAGLDSGRVPFAAISSYETYHFAKPQPAYFREVAARISAFDHPAVMVGNDLENDILPAGQAGLPIFWVSESDAVLPEGLPAGSARGSFSEIFTWLQEMDTNQDQPQTKTIPSLLADLRGGAAAIDAIVREFPADRCTKRPGRKEWSLREIICHLRDVDRDINLVRINTILREKEPFVPGIDSDRWSVERDYIHQDEMNALNEFISTRQEIVDLLENTNPGNWDRLIRHSIFGPTSLKELAAFIVAHDNNHIKQIRNLSS
ncbi:MAG: HAD hydrolase-like protein [Leptolinea sp.]|jgi:FMN phosphatase YigB (HAD superfamily)|nr:HAD hydrolase-like protein [Leptolinea sp.]